MRTLRLLALIALGCEGPADDPGLHTDNEASDPEVDTDNDTDAIAESDATSETDPPDDTDSVVLVETGLSGATSLLTQGGVQVCVGANLRKQEPFLFSPLQYVPPARQHLDGAGLALADLTGDGRDDILAATQRQPLLWRQRPTQGVFVRQELEAVDAADHLGLYGASVADIDDDGDLDLLVTGRGLPNRLYRSDGAGGLEDVTQAAGLGVVPDEHATAGSSWSDVDGDGDLDLFLAGHGVYDEARVPRNQPVGQRSWLFLNDGAGHFTDAPDRLPEALHDGWTVSGLWLDGDGDGDDDLYVANDLGNVHLASSMLWNDGGTFRLDDGSTGLSLPIRAAGAAAGDVDGDGDEDIVVSGPGGVRLLLRGPSGWTEEAEARGLIPSGDQKISWAPEVVDLDNDGRLDLLFAFGAWDSPLANEHLPAQRDAVFLQQAAGRFVDAAGNANLADADPHRGISAVDLDGNGWVDLVAVGLDGEVDVGWQRCGENAWVSVSLRQPAPNVFAVGATVEVWIGGTRRVRRIRAGGSGYGAGHAPRVHLGVGAARELDRLVVRWPDGHVDVYRNLLTRQAFTVQRR